MKPWLKILLIALGVMILFAAWQAYSKGLGLVESLKSAILYPLTVPGRLIAAIAGLFSGGSSDTLSAREQLLVDATIAGKLNAIPTDGGIVYTERNNPAPSGVEIVPGSYASTLFTQ